MINKRYIVIRVSSMDGVDPIAAVVQVISEEGLCWFGKYGRPISAPSEPQMDQTRVVLAFKKEDAYIYETFALKAVANGGPPDARYPGYYRKVLSRVRCWFLLGKVQPNEKIRLDDLVVASSAQPLLKSMRGSMSAHFRCRRK